MDADENQLGIQESMKTRLTLTSDFEVELPKPPNFIRTTSGLMIDVKDLDTKSLADFAEACKQQLIVHAGERRKTVS